MPTDRRLWISAAAAYARGLDAWAWELVACALLVRDLSGARAPDA